MIGIAFDLGRPAFVAFDQQARGDAAERHRGRKEQRPAGDLLFGLADVGNDQLVGLDRARALTPASASDALISLRNDRRPTGSIHSVAFSGNSRWRYSWNSGVSASCLEAAPVLLAAVPRTRARISRQTPVSADARSACHARSAAGHAVHRAAPAHLAYLSHAHRWHTEQLVMCSTSAILYSAPAARRSRADRPPADSPS